MISYYEKIQGTLPFQLIPYNPNTAVQVREFTPGYGFMQVSISITYKTI